MRNTAASSTAFIAQSVRFWFRHLGIITALMLIAGLGRAIQMRAVGLVSSSQYIWLELLVALARILTLAAIVGHGHVLRGGRKLVALVRLRRDEWIEIGRRIRYTIQRHWPSLLIALLLFGLLAVGINKGNQAIADYPAVQITLKRLGALDEEATGMPLFFFLKNITIIPLTLVFEYCLLNWCIKQGKKSPMILIRL